MINPLILAAAQAAHQANKAWCELNNDNTQVNWNEAPDWQRESAVQGVIGVMQGASPEASHKSWMAQKLADGWKYGPIKSAEKKEHPCIVPYDELPPEQKAKDYIFVSVVQSFMKAASSLLTKEYV